MKSAERFAKALVSLTLSAILTATVFPTFVSAAGSGTEKDPYLITTAQQLDNIRNNLSAHYKLANTIDLSSMPDFKPIGNLAKPFTGSFTCDLGADGAPLYAIKNLKVTVEYAPYAALNVNRWECGLFGATKGATFKGIYIYGVDLVNNVPGGNSGAKIYGNENPGMDEMATGGLIGIADSTKVSNCAATGTMNTKSNHTGGLVGRAINGSSFSKSYATVNMTTTGFWNQGGFVGSVESSDFKECFADGELNFKASADSDHSTGGGFAGSFMGGIVNNCYSASKLVKKGRNFVGRTEQSAAFTSCFSLSAPNPISESQPYDLQGCTVQDCYILSGVEDAQNKKWTAVAKSELNSKFSGKGVWVTTGESPKLKNVIVKDGSKYVPGQSPAGTVNSADTSTNSEISSETAVASMASSLTSVISMITALPDAAETLTVDKKEDVKKAKRAVDALNDADYAEIPPKLIGKLEANYTKISALLVSEIVSAIEKLPEVGRLKASDKEKVLAIKDDYDFINKDSREAINPDLAAKLENAVKKVNSFTDDAVTTGGSLSTGETVWVIVLSVGIVAVLALNGWMTVLIIRKKRRSAKRTAN